MSFGAASVGTQSMNIGQMERHGGNEHFRPAAHRRTSLYTGAASLGVSTELTPGDCTLEAPFGLASTNLMSIHQTATKNTRRRFPKVGLAELDTPSIPNERSNHWRCAVEALGREQVGVTPWVVRPGSRCAKTAIADRRPATAAHEVLGMPVFVQSLNIVPGNSFGTASTDWSSAWNLHVRTIRSHFQKISYSRVRTQGRPVESQPLATTI